MRRAEDWEDGLLFEECSSDLDSDSNLHFDSESESIEDVPPPEREDDRQVTRAQSSCNRHSQLSDVVHGRKRLLDSRIMHDSD